MPGDLSPLFRTVVAWGVVDRHRYRDEDCASTLDRPTEALLNRFRARYGLAVGFVSMESVNISPNVSAGYDAALRVTLAYSALEVLESAIGCVNQVEVNSVACADGLRSERMIKLRDTLLREGKRDKKQLMRDLETLYADNEIRDVRPAVERIRNQFSHGVFTPSAAGLDKSRHARAIVEELAACTTSATDARFNAWVQQRIRLRRQLNSPS